MTVLLRAAAVAALVSLGGCAGMSSRATQASLETPAPVAVAQPALATPAQRTEIAVATAATSLLASIEPAAVNLLAEGDKSKATNATFFALQAGRPGAPRDWQGTNGTNGRVSVGPYVRVNNLDCREFTHTVTVGGAEYSRKGTACREVDGNWSVVEAAAA